MRRSRVRTDRGAAAVEFALVLLPVAVILFGLIQYGLYFYSAQTGSSAVNSAVRQLAVGNCQTDAELTTYLNNRLGAAKGSGTMQVQRDYKNINGTTPTGNQPTTVDIGGTVELTVSFHSINMHFPLVPFLSESWVDRRAKARVEDRASQGTCS